MATTIADEQARAVAEKFARLVAERDLDGLRELYTPDARIWHNSDDTEVGRARRGARSGHG